MTTNHTLAERGEREITQVDREAAAEFYGKYLARPGEVPVGAAFRSGHVDESPLIQAFAKHRIAARNVALDEGLEAWNGLARQIMMGFDMGAKTPRALLKHLSMCAETVPDWLLEEPEMKHLDHTMSKGTRCVLIYRAMTEHLRTLSTKEVEG